MCRMSVLLLLIVAVVMAMHAPVLAVGGEWSVICCRVCGTCYGVCPALCSLGGLAFGLFVPDVDPRSPENHI